MSWSQSMCWGRWGAAHSSSSRNRLRNSRGLLNIEKKTMAPLWKEKEKKPWLYRCRGSRPALPLATRAHPSIRIKPFRLTRGYAGWVLRTSEIEDKQSSEKRNRWFRVGFTTLGRGLTLNHLATHPERLNGGHSNGPHPHRNRMDPFIVTMHVKKKWKALKETKRKEGEG